MVLQPDKEMTGADQAVAALAEHEAESNGPEQGYRQHEVGQVLNGYVDGVLGLGQARLQIHEACLHYKNQCRGHEHP